MKKISLIIIMILAIFCLGGCKSKNTDALKFKNEYEDLNGKTSKSGKTYLDVSIDDDNPIVYLTAKEASEKINSDTGVFYFGFPECPWCRNALPVLLNAAKNSELDKIYYVNMYDVRDTMEVDTEGNVVTTKKGATGYSELLDSLDSILDEYTLTDSNDNQVLTGEKRVYVPLVVFVVDGKIVSYHADTVSSQTDPYVALDESQKEELYQIYNDGIHKVLGDVCDEDEEHC